MSSVLFRPPQHAYQQVRVTEDEPPDEAAGQHDAGTDEDEEATHGRRTTSRVPSSLSRLRSSLLPLALLVLVAQLCVNHVYHTLSPSPASQSPSAWLSGGQPRDCSPSTASSSLFSPSPSSTLPWSCEALGSRPLPTTPAAESPFLAWAAEGSSLSLQCPSGTALQVRGLTWGHQCGWHASTGLGSACPWTSVVDDHIDPAQPLALAHSCRLLHLTRGLQRLCDGFSSCSITQAQLPSGVDVCPNRAKLLMAAWQCGAAHVATQAAATTAHTFAELTEVYDAQSAEMSTRAASASASSPSFTSTSAASLTRSCSLVISSQVNISGFGNWWAGGGLWNQLVNVQQMAVLAWSAGCHLSLTAFLPDYQLATEVRFGSVFDLDHINARLCAAHSDALAHPNTTFFKPLLGTSPRTLLPPLQLSDTLLPGRWPGWEPTESTAQATRLWLKSSIKREPTSLLYDTLARGLQAHPNPGLVWLRGGWDSWAGSSDTLPGLQYLRSVFVDSLRPAAPFMHSVDALQRLMGVQQLGSFTFIHFRVESDLIIHASGAGMTLDEYVDRTYLQLITAFDRMASIEQPQDSDERTMGERVRAWPVYLGTGVLFSHRLVTRLRETHPDLRVFTKDLLLYAHCQLPPPSGAPSLTSAEAQRTLISALQSFPWTAGVDECAWLRSEVTGDGRQTNREYWAIVDWQLAQQAAHFVGPTKSSFTVQAVEAIERHPRPFAYTDAEGRSRNATQFAWGLPVEF